MGLPGDHRLRGALPLSDGLQLQRNPHERGEGGEELAPELGERVFRRRWARHQRRPGDDAPVLEVAEAGAQDTRGDARDVLPELAEAPRLLAQIPDHVRRPRAAEEFHSLVDRACGRDDGLVFSDAQRHLSISRVTTIVW